jgi:hypothetical protein
VHVDTCFVQSQAPGQHRQLHAPRAAEVCLRRLFLGQEVAALNLLSLRLCNASMLSLSLPLVLSLSHTPLDACLVQDRSVEEGTSRKRKHSDGSHGPAQFTVSALVFESEDDPRLSANRCSQHGLQPPASIAAQFSSESGVVEP